MKPEQLLEKLESDPESVSFDEVIAVIDDHYDFTPTRFTNGELVNEAGQNNGSCKIFAFGSLHDLATEQTLHCFGDYYRDEVLGDPDGNSHQNIRNFMRSGWGGISFDLKALVPR